MAVGKAKAKAGQAQELSRDFEKLTMYPIEDTIHILTVEGIYCFSSNCLDLCQFKETNL